MAAAELWWLHCGHAAWVAGCGGATGSKVACCRATAAAGAWSRIAAQLGSAGSRRLGSPAQQQLSAQGGRKLGAASSASLFLQFCLDLLRLAALGAC